MLPGSYSALNPIPSNDLLDVPIFATTESLLRQVSPLDRLAMREAARMSKTDDEPSDPSLGTQTSTSGAESSAHARELPPPYNTREQDSDAISDAISDASSDNGILVPSLIHYDCRAQPTRLTIIEAELSEQDRRGRSPSTSPLWTYRDAARELAREVALNVADIVDIDGAQRYNRIRDERLAAAADRAPARSTAQPAARRTPNGQNRRSIAHFLGFRRDYPPTRATELESPAAAAGYTANSSRTKQTSRRKRIFAKICGKLSFQRLSSRVSNGYENLLDEINDGETISSARMAAPMIETFRARRRD